MYISRQIRHASVKTTLDSYGHLIIDANAEQAKKLDSILGFVEYTGSSSDSVRRMLEKMGYNKEKGLPD
jgi:hypothetical protein